MYSRDTGRGNSREGGGTEDRGARARHRVGQPPGAARLRRPDWEHHALQDEAVAGLWHGDMFSVPVPPFVLIGHAASLTPY